MARTSAPTDARRLASAVDRLDAASATDREAAAKRVFDVCVYHVTRVRKTHPAPFSHRGHSRASTVTVPPTPALVFDIVHPHVDRIARRLDRAMRHAETSPHPADAAALIVAVDAQGALAALFAVAQNAGVHSAQLDALALPLRKRSAPALLRTLFSPDMRVANAAKKALRQVAAIASCQSTPWMTSIRAALELRIAVTANRSNLLRTLLARLADILHLVVRQASASRAMAPSGIARKRSSRSSFGALMVRPRPSLSSERRAAEKSLSRSEKSFIRYWFRGKGTRSFMRHSSGVTEASEMSSRSSRRRLRAELGLQQRRLPRPDSADEFTSLASNGAFSGTGSYPGSMFSSVTEPGGALGSPANSLSPARQQGATIKRDAATAMYIFERLVAKRINPALEDRIEVISTLADVAQVTFSGHYASSHNIEHAQEYSDTMAAVFQRYGQKIYAVVLDILFRPVRETDADRIGVFSFHEAGVLDFDADAPYTRKRLTEFPQNAICLPNMDCSGLAAVSCNSLLKIFLRSVPQACSQRMALLTGTVNSAFLHSSEALRRSLGRCEWEMSKIVSAVDALTVLVAVIPKSVEAGLQLIAREPVTLRLVVETCIRSVSATGRLLAQNAARESAPRLSDEGTLYSLRSWQALIHILPGTSSWAGTSSYSSSILFLAQVARRAALISVLQGCRKDRYSSRAPGAAMKDEGHLPVSATGSSSSITFFGRQLGGDGRSDHAAHILASNGGGFETEDENVLTAELQRCIIATTNVAGSNPTDVFFEMYRTVVYLYANELKKMRLPSSQKVPLPVPAAANGDEGATVAEENQDGPARNERERRNGRLRMRSRDARTQSDEDARGVLVENIAVDGELPSRALRRAVMASELDLGQHFDGGQPVSLQHLSSQQTGLPPGMHTFEEFAFALAIILGTLSHKKVTNTMTDLRGAEQMISRDVQRSGSAYLKRVYRRARIILHNNILSQDYDWRAVQYEERIKKLEAEVASLKSMVQQSIEGGIHLTRRKSLPKVLGRVGDSQCYQHAHDEEGTQVVKCGPSGCFWTP